MKISIIIPCFNAIDKIGRCFASLRAIDLAPDEYEVLFIDDCSTDGTHELTQLACKEHPNWRALRLEKNSGSPSQPRNFGINESKGEYLYFLDCDDEIIPHALAKLLTIAEHSNACLIRSELLMDNGRERKRMNQIPEWMDSLSLNKRRELIITKTSTVPTSFVKRSLLQEYKIRWPEHLRMGEDSVFLAEVLLRSKVIEFLPEPTYVYYKVPSLTPASTQLYGKRELQDHVEVWERVQSLLKPQGVDYLKGRLEVGLRVALDSLIFRNRGNIDVECFNSFRNFISKNWVYVEKIKWRKRHSDIILSVKNNNFDSFKKHCRPRLLISGYDLKFIKDAVPDLERYFEIRFDEWTGHETHNESKSKVLLDWAELIWCEWLLKNAEWYMNNKKSYQKLVIRMHRMELSRNHGERLDGDKIDAVITVSPLFFERLLERYPNIPRNKVRLIPNYVRVNDYKTEWHNDRLFTLGMIGILPSKKGFCRALEILNKLRSIDKRFRLEIFGRKPEELPWILRDDKEMSYFKKCEEYIKINELSQSINYNGHVDIKKGLADRHVGYVLSMSDSDFGLPGFESFHLAVADSFASCGLSMVRNWPGAEYLWNKKYIFNNDDSICDCILNYSSNKSLFQSDASQARREVQSLYSHENFIESIVGVYREMMWYKF